MGELLPYILVFLFPAIMAMLQPAYHPWKSWTIWVPTAIFYIFFVGLRHEVGSDWFNYLDMFEKSFPGMDYGDIMLNNDPGFWAIMVWTYHIGEDIHLVNFIAAIVFISGLVIFLRRLTNPWLGLTIAMAYTILTLGMGYVRQGMALGMVFWAITALMDRKFVKFFILVAIGATFHKSAVVMLGFGLFQGGKGKYMKILAGAFMAIGVYFAFLAGQEDHLVSLYINNEAMQSSGAYVRVLMNVIPAGIFFLYRKKWKRLWPEGYTLWMLMALGSLGAFGLVWMFSTAVDRISLYFIPLQIIVMTNLPVLLRGETSPKFMTLAVILFYFTVYMVWLNFASYAPYWLPYHNMITTFPGWLEEFFTL
jgi:hypothetical protein